VRREAGREGILYSAEDRAGAFLDNLKSPYMLALRERAEWVVATFEDMDISQLDTVTKRLFHAWTTEFQAVQIEVGTELFP